MESVIAVTNETVESNGREFTRIYGGFDENSPIITTKQIADLMETDNRTVNQTINRNIESFEFGIHIADLKSDITECDNEILENLGYSQNAINRSKNIYIFSKAGFLLYLKFAEGDKAIELYKNFIEDYFKTKARVELLEKTLEEEIEELKEDKAMLLGKMFMEQDEIKKMEYFNLAEQKTNRIIKLQSRIDNKDTIKALDQQAKLTETKKDYLNQKEFGSCFNTILSSVSVGKLLRVVGLAMRGSKRTAPYQKYCPRYATSIIDQEKNIVQYKWNYNECIKIIDKWLFQNELYTRFYEITDVELLKKFISDMHKHFVE